MKNRLICTSAKPRKRKGFTLLEMLVVVAVIAILCAIAIPSIISISRNLSFRQSNDYAQTLFMAAQSTLSEKRSNGGLVFLQHTSNGSVPVNGDSVQGVEGFDTNIDRDNWTREYCVAVSHAAVPDAFDQVIPPESVESVVRDQAVLVEYNPLTGNVFSVYYSKAMTSQELLDAYNSPEGLPRNVVDGTRDDVTERKKMGVGYYEGSALYDASMEAQVTDTFISPEDGAEFAACVNVAIPKECFGNPDSFAESLSVDLTVTDSEDPSKAIMLHKDHLQKGPGKDYTIDGHRFIKVRFVLDSLKDHQSFANLSADNDAGEVNAALPREKRPGRTDTSIFNIKNENKFRILPGQNISLKADISFTSPGSAVPVDIKPAVVSGVNPMFESVQRIPAEDGKPEHDTYVLTISKGRHLQNLNAIAPSVAKKITSVCISDDIDWQELAESPDPYKGYNGYKSSGTEAPARCLPYFVPIHNEALFGTARFIYPNEDYVVADGSELNQFVNAITGGAIKTVDLSGNRNVPVLTDMIDQTRHATINGSRKVEITDSAGNATTQWVSSKIKNLNIDARQYQAPVVKNSAGLNHYRFYATGETQTVDYQFTGLFGYVNTTIDHLDIVNPRVRGQRLYYNLGATTESSDANVPMPKYKLTLVRNPHSVFGYELKPELTGYIPHEFRNNPCTGALVGATGYKTVISNCGVYFDQEFVETQKNYDANKNAPMTWHGVSGEGAVGGMVGYSKSHRTVSGDLTEDSDALAFSKCFSSVPVSGTMRSEPTDEHLIFSDLTDRRQYGFSNGVGGLVGNSNLSNFFDCYASGHVMAKGYRIMTHTLSNLLDLSERLGLSNNGRYSYGAGGFVGTSHGTRYTNCFASGDVDAEGYTYNTAFHQLKFNGLSSVGGFVGYMNYDATKLYGADDNREDVKIAQHTVFTDCYACGISTGTAYGGVITNDTIRSREGFVGSSGYTSDGLPDLIKKAEIYSFPDYYDALAPYAHQHHVIVPYGSEYIFKDSYFLTQYLSEKEITSSSIKCATPIYYDSLSTLPERTNKVAGSEWETWISNRIETQKAKGTPSWWNLFSKYRYYRDYFEKYDGLEGMYKAEYCKSFPKLHWYLSADADRPVTEYPFPLIRDLPYYGPIPERPAPDAGLVYYEDYLVDGDVVRGYKMSNEQTSTLRNDVPVINDGYAIVSNFEKVKNFRINGVKIDTDLRKSYDDWIGTPENPAARRYQITPLPANVYQEIAEKSSGSEEFYTKLQFNVGGKTCTVYFNPNVALSQVNPKTPVNSSSTPSLEAVKPNAVPNPMLIRSARQFRMLSEPQMEKFIGNGCRYLQQLDIDASAYQWNTWPKRPNQRKKPNDQNFVADPTLSFIGSNTAFTGEYSSSVDLDAVTAVSRPRKIRGFAPKEMQYTGLFNHVGFAGSIHDLQIEIADNTQIGGAAADYCGAAVGFNEGKLKNITVSIGKDSTLTASTGIGGLAGYSGFRDSSNSNAISSVIDCKITASGALTMNSNGAAGKTAISGGLAGVSYGTKYTNVSVELNSVDSKAAMAGGLLGVASGDQLTGVYVSLNGPFTGKSVAGLIGNAVNTAADNGKVQILGGLNGTVSASGAFSTVDNNKISKISNITVDIAKPIQSDKQAAGFAVMAVSSSENQNSTQFGNCTVLFNQNSAKEQCQITGVTKASGFVGMLDGSTMKSCRVYGTGIIKATGKGSTAAGFANEIGASGRTVFCGVTPVVGHETGTYEGNSNSNLVVSAANASGFANSVGVSNEPSTVSNVDTSFTLCTLDSANAAGFTANNCGIISLSTANVDLTNGFGFAAQNTGLIMDSYGWYGDPKDNAKSNIQPTYYDEKADTPTYRGCYFVDRNQPLLILPPDFNLNSPAAAPYKTALVFNADGVASHEAPTTIQPEMLNGQQKSWVAKGEKKAYPYDTKLFINYPCPMIGNHYGNWGKPADVACGVAYYEIYTTGECAVYPKSVQGANEMLPPELRFEDERWYGAAQEVRNSKEMTEYGYAVFYMKGLEGTDLPYEDKLLGNQINIAPETIFGNNVKYVFRKLNTDQIPEDDSDGRKTLVNKHGDETIHFNPNFACEFTPEDNNFEVRTDSQLGNMNLIHQSLDTMIKQSHNIVTDSFVNVPNLKGTYDATLEDGTAFDITCNTPGTWIDSVDAHPSDQVTGVNLGNLSIDLSKEPVQNSDSTGIQHVAFIKGAEKKIVLKQMTVRTDINSNFVCEMSHGFDADVVTINGNVNVPFIKTISTSAVHIGKLVVNGDVNCPIIDSISGEGLVIDNLEINGTLRSTLIRETAAYVTISNIKIKTADDVPVIGLPNTMVTLQNVDIETLNSCFMDRPAIPFKLDQVHVGTLNGTFIKNASVGLTIQNVDIGTLNGSFIENASSTLEITSGTIGTNNGTFIKKKSPSANIKLPAGLAENP